MTVLAQTRFCSLSMDACQWPVERHRLLYIRPFDGPAVSTSITATANTSVSQIGTYFAVGGGEEGTLLSSRGPRRVIPGGLVNHGICPSVGDELNANPKHL